MPFIPKVWKNKNQGEPYTPVTAEELNRIEQGIADAAQSGGGASDTQVAALVSDPASETKTALDTTYAPVRQDYVALARNPESLISGAITRDANGTATAAPVTWPDGTAGQYTATTVSSTFPGAVDAYSITYGSPATKTYTQPAVTRDATSGAMTQVPAIKVA